MSGCNQAPMAQNELEPQEATEARPAKFSQLKTDITKANIELEKVLSGGPGKDGIPAIKMPDFVAQSKAEVPDDVLGILVELGGEKRFYPYNILVWHEIVNDQIGGQPIAVTFCPLCGSALVYDRSVDSEVLEFGVSGLLYESNLLMYDNKTESLWSQALGQAVVGEKSGTTLDLIPFQRITFADLKTDHGEALVLKRVTNEELAEQYPEQSFLKNIAPQGGDSRNYTVYPYDGYDESDQLIFPASVEDQRFQAKEIMYVVPYNNTSVAFPFNSLPQNTTQEVDGQVLTITKVKNEITVKDSSGNVVPGYFEMWFSWATHHQESGVVWHGSKIKEETQPVEVPNIESEELGVGQVVY
jgi:hypothetical protein